MSVISTTTSVNGVRLAHHISEARMVTYHFYCFFRNNAWWRPFRESFKKIYRELFLLRNHHKSSKVNKQLCSRFGFLISKEAVVLRRWESETKILVLSNELIKVELTPLKI